MPAKIHSLPDKDNKTTIFISHRLEDNGIAKKLASRIENCSDDIELYVAGDSEYRNASFGKSIAKDVTQALHETELVLLLFTAEDADWSYCMWEAGVAVDPRKQDRTRTVVVSLNGTTPSVFEGQLYVDVNNKESLRSFFKELCTNAEFFPTLGRPLTSRDESFARQQADKLFKEFSENPIAPEKEVKRRFDNFVLQFSEDAIEALRAYEAPPTVKALDDLLQAGRVISATPGAKRHFGMSEDFNAPTLAQLRELWDKELQAAETDGFKDKLWCEAVLDELSRISRGMGPRLTWDPFPSVTSKNWLYLLVTQYTVLPNQGYEFELALIESVPPEPPVARAKKAQKK